MIVGFEDGSCSGSPGHRHGTEQGAVRLMQQRVLAEWCREAEKWHKEVGTNWVTPWFFIVS